MMNSEDLDPKVKELRHEHYPEWTTAFESLRALFHTQDQIAVALHNDFSKM